MPTSRFERSQTAVASAQGTGSVSFQPYIAGERWVVSLLAASSANATVTVSRNGTIIDTTTADPRPTVTSDSTYDVLEGDTITVSWTGAAAGSTLVATIVGTITVPG